MSNPTTHSAYVSDFMFVRPTIARPIMPQRREVQFTPRSYSARPMADPMLRYQRRLIMDVMPQRRVEQHEPVVQDEPVMQVVNMSMIVSERWVSLVDWLKPRMLEFMSDLQGSWRAIVPDRYKQYTAGRGVKVNPSTLRTQSGAIVTAAVLALGTASALAPASPTATPTLGGAPAAGETARLVPSVRPATTMYVLSSSIASSSDGAQDTSVAASANGVATESTPTPVQSAITPDPTPAAGDDTPPTTPVTGGDQGGQTGGNPPTDPGNGQPGGNGPVTEPEDPVIDPVEETPDPDTIIGGTVDGLTDVVDGVADGLGNILGL